MSQRITTLSGILTVVLLIGGVWWYGTKNKIPATVPETHPQEQPQNHVTTEGVDTSTWRVYRNEKYGIKFQYPNDTVHWRVREYDDSNDKNAPYYPQKGIMVEYMFPKELHISGGEYIAFTVADSRWGTANTQMRDPTDPLNFTFDFNGQVAVAAKMDRKEIESFMKERIYIRSFVFSLPNLPKPWTSNGTINVVSGSSKAPENNPAIFRTILDTVTFFPPQMK